MQKCDIYNSQHKIYVKLFIYFFSVVYVCRCFTTSYSYLVLEFLHCADGDNYNFDLQFNSIFRHGWASTIAAIRTPNMKVICPTAHAIPVSLNAGFRMPSWFDLKTLDISGPEDEDGIKAAAKMVHEMVTKEVHDGIPSHRIMLGGFSQGGALALYSALTYAEPLAGVMALSCWLPLYKTFPQSRKCPDTVPVRQF